MIKHLHYELMAGSYSVINLAEKRSALMSISFLILVDERGYSPFKTERTFVRQSLVRNQIVAHPSMIRPLFSKNTAVCADNIDIREYSIFAKQFIPQDVDMLAASIVVESLSNMMIEVYDPYGVNKRYFVYSPNRLWNIRAIEFGMSTSELLSEPTIPTSLFEMATTGMFHGEDLTDIVLRSTAYEESMLEFRKLNLSSIDHLERLCIMRQSVDNFVNVKITGPSFTEEQSSILNKALYVLFDNETLCRIVGDEYTTTDELMKIVDGSLYKTILVLNKFLVGDPTKLALSSVPIIEVVRTINDEYRFHFLWHEYVPTYLNECGIIADRLEVFRTPEMENIYNLFHIYHNKDRKE